jgi:hypothetical protein
MTQDNDLTMVAGDDLLAFPQVTDLLLDGNGIARVSAGAFAGLASLERLQMARNPTTCAVVSRRADGPRVKCTCAANLTHDDRQPSYCGAALCPLAYALSR